MSKVAAEAGAAADDELQLVEQLRAVARTKRLPDGFDLATLATETRSARIRDAAALAMLDLGHPEAARTLTALVARKDTIGHNGTILYALNELGANVPLHILIEIIVNGVYEARAEALMLLEHSQATPAERAEAIKTLLPFAISKDEELAAAASNAIDILEEV